MKAFTELFFKLDQTTRTTDKLEAIKKYLQEVPPVDAAWATYVLSGRKIGKTVSSRLLRQWAAEASGFPAWLVERCYQTVGDLAETLSLLVPDGQSNEAPELRELIDESIKPLAELSQENQREKVRAAWSRLNADQRLVFHKLLGGNFRVGISKQLLIRALAELAGIDSAVIAHRLAGNWMPDENAMTRLLGSSTATDAGIPYPFMLAQPLSDSLTSLGPIDEWLTEWKWDGIRAQLIKRRGHTSLWSRGDEAVSRAFPEVIQAATMLPEGTVLDGEIVGWDVARERPLPFTQLQRRLNRQSVELTFWPDVSVTYIAFDVLETEARDVRDHVLSERRKMLAACLTDSHALPTIRLSLSMECRAWNDVTGFVTDSRKHGVEGVILKRLDSPYLPGRPAGYWWKLKIEPYTVDAVLMAAEPGRGRRAGLLTDYTFGVWDGEMLVPVTKAYTGLTDAEIAEVDRFVRRHTTARHGPVHSIEPILVFEIGFEAIQRSLRHKSGIALRFPRILRMRKDKRVEEADRLHTLCALLEPIDTK